jgi:hypothetical protein
MMKVCGKMVLMGIQWVLDYKLRITVTDIFQFFFLIYT